MDLQHYLRNTIKGKTVVLVGNAPFQRNCSDLVDSHECVFRFNLFSLNGYTEGLCGNKTTHWYNNLAGTIILEEDRDRIGSSGASTAT